jgi:hypothetical protein
MDLGTLARVLRRNRFAVAPRFLGRLGGLLLLGAVNSALAWCEERDNGAAIRATPIEKAPIFIVGHWRSGTTHLHNLLGQDDRFACPTTYQTMFPRHFCYSQRRGSPLFDRLAPGRRPMDGMPFSAQTPHEEEFAVAALAAISPYMRFLFPVTEIGGCSQLDPEHLSHEDLRKWTAAFLYFIRKLTFSKGKQIVLKSPPNMCRIGTIVKLFPDAKFVHIVRNPYEVYASTVKLWRQTLRQVHLQMPVRDEVERIVLSWYVESFALFERDRQLLRKGSFHELKFEDLEKTPLACLESLYADLELAEFAAFRKRVIPYLESIAGHRKNRHTLDPAARRRLQAQLGAVISRYRYSA